MYGGDSHRMPRMLDIISLDGHWAQVIGAIGERHAYVRYLDMGNDSYPLEVVDLAGRFKLVKEYTGTVADLIESGAAEFSTDEIERIHTPESIFGPDSKLNANAYGEYKMKGPWS